MHFYKLHNKGFTLVELLVAIAIFTVMTALLVVKYAGFSEGMTLTNLAYDVALTLREAQSYGINVQDSGNLTTQGDKGQFNTMYGVSFNRGNDKQFILYADLENVGRYAGNYIRINKIKQGNQIEYLCAGNGNINGATTCNSVTMLDVQYRRPDPTPKIYGGTNKDNLSQYSYAEIRMKSPNGSYRKVVVRSSGQISVEEMLNVTQTR